MARCKTTPPARPLTNAIDAANKLRDANDATKIDKAHKTLEDAINGVNASVQAKTDADAQSRRRSCRCRCGSGASPIHLQRRLVVLRQHVQAHRHRWLQRIPRHHIGRIRFELRFRFDRRLCLHHKTKPQRRTRHRHMRRWLCIVAAYSALIDDWLFARTGKPVRATIQSKQGERQ